MAQEAENLAGEQDQKLLQAVEILKSLLKDGYSPIVFCRFIPTAEYVAKELRDRVGRGVEVSAVTGLIPSTEREERILELAKHPQRILVCTDCLSEGINLQEHFDAVIHYDLSWNPTRHEQREGRVDRFGQDRSPIRVVTYFGVDNQIDGVVLDVLLRKQKQIRTSLGISVPVPVNINVVMQAVMEGLLLRSDRGIGDQQIFPELEEYLKPTTQELYGQWDKAEEREKQSRTMFAQMSLKVDEVARELEAAREASGSAEVVESFTCLALQAHKGVISRKNGSHTVDLGDVPRALKDQLPPQESFIARFGLPVEDGELYLSRTHPVVEGLASFVLDTALDPIEESAARRAGAIRTSFVEKRTTLLLMRYRFDLISKRGETVHSQLAEECRLLAFTGAPEAAEWLNESEAIALIDAEPEKNLPTEQARDLIARVSDNFADLLPRLEAQAEIYADDLRDAHKRVRDAAGLKGIRHEVNPQLPPDVLGIFIFLPTSSEQG